MTSTSEEVTERIAGLLRERPRNFYAILQSLSDVEYRTILAAWGTLREQEALARDHEGNYVLRAKEGGGNPGVRHCKILGQIK